MIIFGPKVYSIIVKKNVKTEVPTHRINFQGVEVQVPPNKIKGVDCSVHFVLVCTYNS